MFLHLHSYCISVHYIICSVHNSNFSNVMRPFTNFFFFLGGGGGGGGGEGRERGRPARGMRLCRPSFPVR